MSTVVADYPALHTASLLLQAGNLRRELADVVERSRDLVWLGGELQRSANLRLPQIGGGSDADAALVAEMITDTAMCLGCISKRSGVPTEQVNAILRSITGTLRLSIGMRQCAACLERKTSFAINTNGNASHHSNGATRDAVLSFLEKHRGDAFCSRCISSQLFDGRDIDVTMRHLEGFGVLRRHGRCAACGSARLVASVSNNEN
jgi:hypothetical protein